MRLGFTPSSDRIELIAKYLDVPSSFLTGATDLLDGKLYHDETKFKSIPVYAPISCGTGGFTDDLIIDYVSVPSSKLSPSEEYFSQYALGDSMSGANINDGDLLIFRKTSTINNNQIGCFCIDYDMTTCKRFTRTNDGMILLLPSNKNYKPIRIDVNNNAFRVVGVLVSVMKFYNQ